MKKPYSPGSRLFESYSLRQLLEMPPDQPPGAYYNRHQNVSEGVLKKSSKSVEIVYDLNKKL
jgi:hypothetical protein